MKPYKLLLSIAAVVAAVSCSTDDDIESRIDKLLSQMTLDEKIGQMNMLTQGEQEWMDGQIRSGAIGSFLNEVDPAVINRMQRIAVEESRLGIPLIASRDVIHGFHTIFPIPLGQGATFDRELVERGARIAAIEAAACGIRWTFSPMLDVARDPRWGRIAESFGEDTYLISELGTAMIKGYQGDGTCGNATMAACAKHFAGYGAAEGGRDYNGTPITERTLHNFYLPPFEASVKAGAMTLMTSFNEIDGIPSTGNEHLLQDILRRDWGFDGAVVTDWNSAGEMIAHGFVADEKGAAVCATNAGVDIDMMSHTYINNLAEAVREGLVSEKRIDEAVRNILRVKFRLGLFDNPYADEKYAAEIQYDAAHLADARRAAVESAILLKNDAAALPLQSPHSILVTGPLADAPHDQLGTWTFDGEAERTVTPLAALRSAYGDDVRIVYYPALSYSRDKSRGNLARLTAMARNVDAVVAFVGEEAILSGEAHSLSNLNLQGAQSDLLRAAKASGKPVIAVVMAGRPLTIGRDLANCDAMLYCFHPGTMGGEAIADLLFGREVPSGKCPATFLKDAGQAPYYYNRNNTGRPAAGTETLLDDIPLHAGQTSLGCTSYYLDSGFGPLFPFGYGLSYTTFEYDDIALDKPEYAKDDTIRVTFTLRNTGDRDATEVAQLYVRDMVGSITRPLRELKRFDRITLKAGESRKCEFTLPVAELAFMGIDRTVGVESGDFRLWVAGDSASGEPVSFRVI